MQCTTPKSPLVGVVESGCIRWLSSLTDGDTLLNYVKDLPAHDLGAESGLLDNSGEGHGSAVDRIS